MRARWRVPLIVFLGTLSRGRVGFAGTWTPLVRQAPGPINLMLQLSDGTVMAANNGGASIGSAWYRLTPDIHGSYLNGTWSSLASMHDTRLYYSSAVLRDGRVFVAGGEYGTGASRSEVYDPLTNVWTQLTIPTTVLNPLQNSPVTGSPQAFLDSDAKIISNGSVLITPVAPRSSGGTVIYNPNNNTWSNGPRLFRGSYQDEASWVKLPDESILTIDPFGTNSERYIPATNTWINDGIVPASLYDPFGSELGAALLLPNGKAFFLGSTGHTAIYTPTGTTSPGTWIAGPDIPDAHGCPDAPAAMMVTGNILCAVSPVPTNANHFPTPTTFYEYDYIANAFASVNGPTGPSDNISSYQAAMLVLPDGTVLYSHFTSQLYIYQPTGAPLASGRPVINNITSNPDGSYHLTGTGLNGISEGAAYGDDLQMDSNYPLIRLTAGANVYYVRSWNWSSTGVQTGAQIVSTEFKVPPNLIGGNYSLVVVANGISSDPIAFSPIIDCNQNGIPDDIDIANATSPDCNMSSIPDECEVPPLCPFCADCQHDGVPDICQIPPICPNCLDCDANQIPDACEVDCNSNSIPDACDIAGSTSLDCQPDGIPDECQLPPLCATCPDCNQNGIPDACDISSQFSLDCQTDGIPDDCQVPPICSTPDCPDCNHNGVPDSCEIASGAESDCNNDQIPDRCQTDPQFCGGSCLTDCDHNFVPDSCQLVAVFSQQSPDLSPIYSAAPQSYTLLAPPSAIGDVTLTFRAIADFGSPAELINVDINGTPLGPIFGDALQCAFDQRLLTVPAATFNAAVAGGNAVLHMIASAAVDPICGPANFISVKVDYPITSNDCNNNSILDSCELAMGAASDCNANGIPDACDIAAGTLTDQDANNIPDECDCNLLSCRGDIGLDALVDGQDIHAFLSCLLNTNLTNGGCACADMNADLKLNSADIALFVARLTSDPSTACH